MSRQEITEELDARIRRAYARGSNYYLVAQHDRATDFSYIVDIGKDLYEFASYNKPVVAIDGVDEATYSLSEINEEVYNLMQTLDAVGILIRGLVYDSQFIFSRFQHLSLSELRDRLALLGPDAKYDIVFGYINHNGPADPLSVEELLGRLHYEYNLNK